MIGMVDAALLLASGVDRLERLRAIEAGFRAEKDNTGMLLLIGAGLLLVLVLLILSRCSAEGKSNVAKRKTDYFGLTMHQLRLRAEERDLLRQIAQRGELSVPGAMLLSPHNLAHGVRQAQLGDELDASLRKRAGKLCKQIFDCPLPR